jgi:hypothetical protein
VFLQFLIHISGFCLSNKVAIVHEELNVEPDESSHQGRDAVI